MDSLHRAGTAVRILHLSTRLIIGGSQENTLLSCIGAANHGHTVALGYGPIYGPEGSLLPRVMADARIERIEIPALTRSISPLSDWRCARQLRALIRAWRPDVVHTHSSKAGILGRGAAWAEKVPVIVHTIHGLPFHPYQSWIKNAAYVRAERWAAKRCHAIVSVADAMTVAARAHKIGTPDQFITIRSGMEIEPWLHAQSDRARIRQRFGWDDETLVFGTVARLSELKGHDDLIDAFTPLLRAESKPKVALLWIGDGWLRERLFERLKKSGIADRVARTGLVDPSEIPSLLSAVDVLVHPSYREGLPRAVVQGSLSGKPVIAYDVDGACEVCKTNETGILVKAGDCVALRAAAERLIAHPSERIAMGERGRTFVQHDFDWRTMVDQLEALYARIARQSK